MISNRNIDLLSDNQIATFFSPASHSESVSFTRTKMDIREDTTPTTKTFTFDMTNINNGSIYPTQNSIDEEENFKINQHDTQNSMNGHLFSKKNSLNPYHEKNSFLRLLRRMSVLRSTKKTKSNSSSNQTIYSESGTNTSSSIFQRISSFRSNRKNVFHNNLHTCSHPSLFLESTPSGDRPSSPKIESLTLDEPNEKSSTHSMEFIKDPSSTSNLPSQHSVTFSEPFLYSADSNNQTCFVKCKNSTTRIAENDINLSEDYTKCASSPPSYLRVSLATYGYSGLMKNLPLKDLHINNSSSVAMDNSALSSGKDLTKKNVRISESDKNELLDASLYNPTKRNLSSQRRPVRGISCIAPEKNNEKYETIQSSKDVSTLRVQLRRQRTKSQNLAGESGASDDSSFHRSSLIMMMVSARHTSNMNIDQVSMVNGNDLKSPDNSIHEFGDSTSLSSPPNSPFSKEPIKNEFPVISSTPMRISRAKSEEAKQILCPPKSPLDTVPELAAFTDKPPLNEKRDGHYFLELVDKTEEGLIEKAKHLEEIIKSCQSETDQRRNDDNNNIPQVSEEILGDLRTTVGQTRLLAKEKFVQFRKLCHENLRPNDVSDSIKPLDSDLEGFWALVMLEVDNIQSMFARTEKLEKDNWKEEVPKVENHPQTTVRSKPKPKTTSTTKSKEQIAREEAQRAAARQRIMALKKEMASKKKKLTEQNLNEETGFLPV